MKILGIETVTRIGSLAVVENGLILGQVTIDTSLRHASGFILSLDNLLGSLKLNLSKIDVIGIDIGPGSFTGIRVGVASALGLASPDKKPLVGVCSLEVLSYQASLITKQKILIPIIDAKRDAFYSACYKLNGKNIKLLKKPYVAKAEDLAKHMLKDSFVFGPDIKKFLPLIPAKNSVIIDQDNTYPYAGMVAKIAELKIKEKKVKRSIEPMYMHQIKCALKRPF